MGILAGHGPAPHGHVSEMESEGGRERPRRNVVGAAEGREKVIQRLFVEQIHHRQSSAEP